MAGSAITRRTRDPAPESRGEDHAAARSPAPAGLHAAGNLALQRLFAGGVVRAKLEVGSPDDPQEHEADRIARRVVENEAPACACTPGNAEPCPACRQSSETAIRRKAEPGVRSRRQSAAIGLDGGRPLGAAERSYFEPRLGADLSGVRIHTGRHAEQSAQQLHARAYTLGSDIVFGAGHYRPETQSGRYLIAHELAHVLQQGGAAKERIQRAPESADPAEAQFKPLEPEKEAPKPGPNTVKFHAGEAGVLLLSEDQPYMRRTAAQLIGKLGLDRARGLVASYENQAKFRSPREKAVAAVLREQFTAMEAAWKAFSAQVRNAAIVRLKMNHAALGDWETYVASLTPASFMNQTLASQELVFMESLAAKADPETGRGPYVGPHDMKALAEMRAWSPSPGRRAWVEMLNQGLITGGCMDCHVQKAIPDYDAGFAADDPARMPPVFRLARAARQEASAGGSSNPSILGGEVGGASPSDAVRSYVAGSPGLTSVAQSVESIQPKVLPLEVQYKVVPEGVINAAITPEQLVSVVLGWIAARRQGYLDLIDEVSQEDYDFLQLIPIVQIFLGTASHDVRAMITAAQAQSVQDREDKQTGEFVLGVAAMLLAIFPPTAPIGLALGGALAVSGLVQGYQDFQQGMMYLGGTGAGIFTPEQEAAAGLLMAGGIMNMAMSAFSLAGTGMAAGEMFGKAPPGASALARSPEAPLTGAGAAPPPGATAAWRITSQDLVTGEVTIIGKNLAAGGAGEMVTLRINIKTGMGTATLHGPNGMTVPVVNGKLQFSAGLLPAAGGTGAGAVVPKQPAAAPAAGSPPLLGPAGEANPSFMLPYLTEGPVTVLPPGRPQLGSRVILPSAAPEPGQAPVYVMPLGPEGAGGVRLMNRGLQPRDFPDQGFRGPMIADDPAHLELWLQAEAKAAGSARDNIYKRWLAAVKDGTVSNWSSSDLQKVYKSLWDEYKVLARAQGIDVATIHHWNFNKDLYPEQVVDPRNLMPVYGQARMSGGDHPAHQHGLHPLMSSGHPTRDPIDPIHELPLYNYNVPRPNPDYPGMPYGWHPPMRDPADMPFGWNPFYPPEWNWPQGAPPFRPPK
jgi:hypothetical protein